MAADLDVRLVHMPLAADHTLAPVEALQQLGEKWATQRCTVEWSTFNAFGHHLFQIAQAQSVGQVPAHAQQDHRLVQMAAL